MFFVDFLYINKYRPYVQQLQKPLPYNIMITNISQRATRFLLSLLSVFTLITSCSSDDSYVGTTPEITFTETTPKEQTINADDTEAVHPISFTTNYTWRVNVYEENTRNIENNTSWLHVSQYGGSRGTYELQITITVNTTDKDRKADIVISCGGEHKFTLIQKAKKNNI